MTGGRQPSGRAGELTVLADAVRNLVSASSDRFAAQMSQRLDRLTDRLTAYAGGDGKPGQLAAAKGAQKLKGGDSPVSALFSAGLTGGREAVRQRIGGGRRDGRGGGNDLKVTNIFETIDIGAPVWVVYNQWTQFEDFPGFMKKVEHVEQESDERLTWKAQVFWSHRAWESTIIEQVPDERIVWRSTGEKGSVDGTVTFHELAPDLTRIVLVLEYHPQGFFERTGNIWRAQGRRVRLELKHFARHVMTETILDPDAVEGWRGEIRDGQVVQDHESAQQQDRGAEGQQGGGQQAQPSGGGRGGAAERRRDAEPGS